MERKKRKYHRIAYKDRVQIEMMQEKSTEEIAVAIGVSESTIRRELKRGGAPYRADVAQKMIL